MRRVAPLVLAACLVVGLAAGLVSQAPLPKPSDAFDVPEGCQVNLFAESPQLYNPTAIDIDHKGRVWVTEAVNYRKWRNKGKSHPRGDRVVVLEDTDGDGKCDKSTVFVQEKDLLAPLGICVIGDRVLVSCSPHAILYTDTDGDLKPDKRELFLTGFGGKDHDHGLHSFTAGYDGYLYFNTGNQGPHNVKDKAGKTIRIARGQPHVGGAVLRVRPDGTGLEVLAHNFRNPYEVAVDAFGNLFQSDNDDDGNRSCRTQFVMEGGNHGYYSADGHRGWRADRRPDQATFRAHWHQDDPGVIPAGTQNGGGGPTGVVVFEGPALPGCPPGTVLNCDAGAGVVYAHLPEPKGAGFELRMTIFMQVRKGTGGKRAKWFRPSDVAVGPDGSIYVADWYDPGVGGHAAGDRAAYGRILRVTGPATKAPHPAAALWNPAQSVRGSAFAKLDRHDTRDVKNATGIWRNAQDPRARARALAWLATTAKGTEFVKAGLREKAPRLQVTAIRLARLHHAPEAAFGLVARLAGHPDAAVRREVLLSTRGVPLARCRDTLTAIARTLDADDRFLVEAFGIAAAGRESAVYTHLLTQLGEHPSKWSARFATLAWRLHPPEAVRAHTSRALATELDLRWRRLAIDALAFTKARSAALAMRRIAQTGPADTRAYATYWLQHRATNDWRGYGVGGARSKLADAELLWQSGVMQDGEKPFDVAVVPGRTLFLVVDEGADGYSHDWADWVAPTFVGDGKRVPLMRLPWLTAKTGWGRIHKNKNAGGGMLALDGAKKVRGIGTHAPSQITYRVPVGVTRFRGRVGPDHGGTSQPGSATKLEFKIYQQKASKPSPVPAWRAALLDPERSDAERTKTALAMAGDAAGGRALLGLFEQGKLPKVVRAAVARVIFENPDRTVRLLAAKHFPIPGTAGLQLPKLADIAALKGTAKQGAPHFGKRCASCHVFDGVGKDIGPNLTAIGKKYDAAALLEAILNPNAGIAFGYETWLVEKKNGEFVSGFLLADGDPVVIKDQDGKRHAIPAADIRSKTESKTSMMPPALVAGMSAQDLADLIAFLRR